MFARKLLLIVIMCFTMLLSAEDCYAEKKVEPVQVCAWKQNVDIYAANNMNSEHLSCKISNQDAEIIGSGLLINENVTVRTTLLIDISQSIPKETRKKTRALIDSLIKNIGSNEQYRIVTFGKKMKVLQDFSSDRYDLVNAADNIEFNGKLSIVYDAIFNTIPKIRPISGKPCFYRTIVITDGVDDTQIGVTKEELFLKLQQETYPIDVVEVSKKKVSVPNKELGVLMRISGGSYANLYPKNKATKIVKKLDTDHIFWIRAIVPETLLDGSVRQIDVFDGKKNIQLDVKIPVFDISLKEDSNEIDDNKAEDQKSVPIIDEEQQSDMADDTNIIVPKNRMIILIGCGIGVCAILVLVMIIIHGKQKKNKQIDRKQADEEELSASDETEQLTITSDNGHCIRVRNEKEADQSWDVVIDQGILLGRGTHCHICVSERSVAREQCRIFYRDGAMVENLSKSNITKLNGQEIGSEARILKSGDRLVCGRMVFIIELLDHSDLDSSGNLRGTQYINV